MFFIKLLRKIYHWPPFLSLRLFSYDCWRFIRYAGCFHQDSRSACIAKVIMAYHIVEKGLTMPRRRLDFGHAAVLNLIELVEHFEREFGQGEIQVTHAIGCVKEYLHIHCVDGFDTKTDVVFWSRVKNFCSAHLDVPAAKQNEFTNEQFFAERDSPFPVFATSRHTVRHYAGVVDIHRIKAAIELAMTAPSACNRQFAKVYCVSNHKLRDQVLGLQNGNRGFGSDADKLLVVTADLRCNRWAEERNDVYTNVGIFIMNLCYALHYHKIAHCILNWSVRPKEDVEMRKILNLPKNEVVVVLLSCGNAPDRFMVANSPRRAVQDIFSEIN